MLFFNDATLPRQLHPGDRVKSDSFWTFFNHEARPKLDARAETFGKIFEYLDAYDRPVGIIETGCVRKRENWAGDGGSTILFDQYAGTHPGTAVYTVDLSPEATSLCRSVVSERIKIHTGDSVAFLREMAKARPADLPHLDLLYLDSYDVDFDNPLPSAFHHIKELLAASPLLKPETLVVVDDSPPLITGYLDPNGFRLMKEPAIGGKGKLIAEYAGQIGLKPVFIDYQCGWTGLGITG